MPAQANATLIAVGTTGTPADFDVAPGAPAVKWTGAAPAYYRESRAQVVRNGNSDREVVRTLVIDTAVLDSANLDEDDTVTWLFRGVEDTRPVQLVERRDLDGIPTELRTSRLTLK